MEWIGGPAKDLGEKEGSGKFAAVGTTGASKLEGGGSKGMLSSANQGKGKGGPLTKDKVKGATEEALQNNGGGGNGKVEANRAVSENSPTR